MRKFTYLFLCFVFATQISFAKQVPVASAQSLAQSFYQQNSVKKINNMSLTHAETSLITGEPLYYVFNINSNDGFVIVTADDAAHPIIGYSHEGQYVLPEKNSPMDYWMKSRANEIAAIKNANVPADISITNEWAGNFAKNPSGANNKTINNNDQINSVVLPLLQTTWNQSPNYNAQCPGGSVTGCVATAMGQIMKYWNYPNTGVGSNSYCDCTGMGFQMQYGTLTANFAATTFSWSLMPNSIASPNAAIADLMIKCGISVDMDYSPSGSSAYVIVADNPICAQHSYTAYFKYDPSTIQGLKRVNYTDPNWIALIEADLNIGRPVQYAGFDPSAGGHTWVADGYDINNNFHMNWGWGGTDNGYFSINLLNPSPYNFSQNHEVCIGIKPLPYANFSVSANPVCGPQTIHITDLSANNPTTWSYTMTGGTPSVSAIANPTVTYTTTGIYTISLITSNNTNTSVPFVTTVTVSSTPTLTVTAAPICSGGTATISSSGAITYSLNTGPTGSNILVTPSVTTNYTVTGFNGCTNTKTITVVVNPSPTVNAMASTMSVCAGSSVTISATGATSYSWSNGVQNQSAVVYPLVNTVYTVIGTTAPCSKNATVSIMVDPLPNLMVYGIDTIFCAGQTITLTASGAANYSWNTGATAFTITDSPNIATSYTVTGTDALGCSSSSVVTQSITEICTGIAEQTNNGTVNVYPNPSNGDFTISLSKVSNATQLEVYNYLGQLILKYNPKSLSNKVSLINEAAGVYQMRITEDGKVVYKTKIIKN